MEPIWKLLRSTVATEIWNGDFRAALKSALCGRQWTQQRCWAAGWDMHHSKCLFCAHQCLPVPPLVPSSVRGKEGGALPAEPQSTDVMTQPTAAQIVTAPLGTIRHRIYRCPHLEPLRAKLAPKEMVEKELTFPVADTDLALERALFPVPFDDIPKRASQASFHWVLRPPDGLAMGKFYTDGSLLDGPSKLLGRCGWSFVALSREGFVVAAAYGVTPLWITCCPGAESWAALQAANTSLPGSTFRIDCEPCVKAIHFGMARAARDSNPLARVHRLMVIAFDDTPNDSVVWMPSHTSARDGSFLSAW